jgi:mannose-6-phosphate isomerase-like protein (cupin superfamily)
MVDPARVAQAFSQGATVVFGAVHDRHEPLRQLCAAVTAQLSARTQTNIYLTPPHAQGFKPHWDTHDVFVLQVSGTKRWRIYGGGPELPLPDQKFDPALHTAGPVEEEFTLAAGDVLYIPRGVMHAATTTDEQSLHITLGVLSYTWADLLVDSLGEVVARDAAWRESLPVGFAVHEGAEAALRDALRAKLATLPAAVDLGAVIEARRHALESHLRPRASDHLQQVMAIPSLQPADLVRWRDGVPSEVELRGERVAILSGAREVELPGAAAATLDLVRRGDALTAGSIPDGLDWESRRVVLAALIREGWLVCSRGLHAAGAPPRS